MLVFYQNTSIK